MARRLAFLATLLGALATAPAGRSGLMADVGQRVTAGSARGQPASLRCGACHSTEYSLWLSHPHSRFLVDPKRDPRGVAARWGEGVEGWSKVVGLAFDKSDVALAFGVLEYQLYFRRDADGHRLLPAQWNLREKRWEPLPPSLERLRKEKRTWEQECAGCHVTAFNLEESSFGERNVACSACHGAGVDHMASGGLKPVVRIPGLPRERQSDLCGSCHSRGKDRRTGRPYPVGFKAGGALEEIFELEKPVTGKATEFFWADGTERQAYMEYQGFRQSGHYRAGLACTTCHLAHGSDYPYNLRHKTVDLCATCHEETNGASPTHRSHPKGQATCVDCHMAVLDASPGLVHAHTHTFHFREPSGSAGASTPDACTVACHDGKDARWADGVLKGWRGR